MMDAEKNQGNVEGQTSVDEKNGVVSADNGEMLPEEAAAGEQKIVYDEIVRDEKGLIERDGFKMKGVNYGPEFDQENLDRAFKFSIIAAVTMLIFVILCFFLFLNYYDRLPWQI